jgi:hypothetical protein
MPPSSRAAVPARRTLLVGGALACLGALGGVGAGLLRHSADDEPPAPGPGVLLAAVHAEQVLLAHVAAATRARSAPAAVLRALRTDHAAHLAALTAAVSIATGTAGSSAAESSPATSASPPSADRGQLRAAENAAAASAARRALLLTGRDAVLLASIAASEACHAELLG